MSFQAPNASAVSAVKSEASKQGSGSRLSFQTPKGNSQPKTYQKL